MSRTVSRRLLAQSPLNHTAERVPSIKSSSQCLRSYSNSSPRRADDEKPKSSSPWANTIPFSRLGQRNANANANPATRPPLRSPSLNPKAMVGEKPSGGDMGALATSLHNLLNQNRDTRQTMRYSRDLFGDGADDSGSLLSNKPKPDKSWQMHIYASRQNVHITVMRPPAWTDPITEKQYGMGKHPHRTVALSMSAGNIGFRKAGRKHYDSAFQLAGYVLTRMRESGIAALIEEMEVSLRGFGAGREAVSRALLGTEGRQLRHKVTRVTDATRLKFGGTRSRKPRRLG